MMEIYLFHTPEHLDKATNRIRIHIWGELKDVRIEGIFPGQAGPRRPLMGSRGSHKLSQITWWISEWQIYS